MDNYEDVKKFLKENGLNALWETEDKFRNSHMLRLDFELAEDSKFTDNQIIDVAFICVEGDLAELAYNGDVDNWTDPLLKSFDGATKRGKSIKSKEITSWQMFSKYKPKKKSTEYTVYLRFRVEFE